jgi:small subunit ribosomal protein S15|tara:strand:- start:1020 stop:1277 length:258 start_codon:yes stop_codon:yes gene_type:complete
LKGLGIVAKKDEKINKNVGGSEFQITLFTNRIKKLTEHLKLNKKDENTRRGLMKLVGKRKRLLSYVKRKSNDNYESLIKSLGLRR